MLRDRLSRLIKRRLGAALAALVLALAISPVAVRAEYAGFPDVGESDWYVTSGVLDYALDNGLFTGYDNGTFGPTNPVTRGQAATILYRMAGEPEHPTRHFPDVAASAFYAKAVAWAGGAGVVNGYDNGMFGPDTPVTREQLAVMLANYARIVGGVGTTTDHAALDALDGAEQVSPWARDALGWCVDQGILTGAVTADGTDIQAQGTAARCQAAKMFTVLHSDVLGLGGEGDGNIVHIPGVDVANYADDAHLIDDATAKVNADANQATVPADDADDIQVGDIVVVDPDDLENGIALKVTAVRTQGATAIITGTEPKPDEVFDRLEIEGERTISPDDIELAPGVELVDQSVEQLASGELELQSITLKLGKFPVTATNGKKVSFGGTVTITVDPTVSYKAKLGSFIINSTASATLKVESSITGNVNMNFGGRIELYNSHGATPFTVYLITSINGKLSLDCDLPTFSATASVRNLIPKLTFKADASNAKTDVSGSVSGQLGAGASVGVKVLNIALIDVGTEAGASTSYKTTPHLPEMVCADWDYWLFWDVYANREAKWLDEQSTSIWGKSNSPVHSKLHYENGTFVPECTWGTEKPTDPEDPDNPSDPGTHEPGDVQTTADGLVYAIGDYVVDGTVGTGSWRSALEAARPGVNPTTEGCNIISVMNDQPNFGGGEGLGYTCGHGAYIIGYTGKSRSVTIPKSIDGVDVVFCGLDTGGAAPSVRISSIDASRATALKAFAGPDMQTYSLTFGSLPNLTNIFTGANTTITNTFDATGCPAVRHICFGDGTSFSGRVAFNAPNLETFSAAATNLTGSFSFGTASKLREVAISASGITSLNLSGCSNLEALWVEHTPITALDVSRFSRLEYLVVAATDIADLSPLRAWLAQPGHRGGVFEGVVDYGQLA